MADQKPAEAEGKTESLIFDAVTERAETLEVILQVGISGLRDGKEWPAVGEPFTLPADEAAALIANGYATPVE